MAELKLNAALGAALPIFEVITTSATTTLIHSNRRPYHGRRRCRHPLPLPLPTPIPTHRNRNRHRFRRCHRQRRRQPRRQPRRHRHHIITTLLPASSGHSLLYTNTTTSTAAATATVATMTTATVYQLSPPGSHRICGGTRGA